MEQHYPELRALASQDPEFSAWLGEAACPEVQRCELWPRCDHDNIGDSDIMTIPGEFHTKEDDTE